MDQLCTKCWRVAGMPCESLNGFRSHLWASGAIAIRINPLITSRCPLFNCFKGKLSWPIAASIVISLNAFGENCDRLCVWNHSLAAWCAGHSKCSPRVLSGHTVDPTGSGNKRFTAITLTSQLYSVGFNIFHIFPWDCDRLQAWGEPLAPPERHRTVKTGKGAGFAGKAFEVRGLCQA